ncbi:DUF5133 domain-containing protein [Streptomyces capillispiralis]|uniref:Uncharacterized protein DUF5133 n=1 Tax=Streptomyces capillispiralis TaxID=68182 RepID=A0A561T8C4_9ACTN|nr:DUF5133 domain-containing protein [Streptomyces capillispiralis]TWF83350.1 uncharacterized protein DUF5133 [Streptomyces capillispiralis]GHH94184.1 hypothetical protein GCM10017779_46410 [Streptomyces capillispiralis]
MLGPEAKAVRPEPTVVKPAPKVVRQVLTRYATLRIAQAERYSPAAARELDDVTHRLCVMMGTPVLRDAIARADALLAGARPTDGRTPAADGEGLPLAG